MKINSEFFIDKLYSWHDLHDRNLPWKVDNNPYKIWVSEIILQQTRVDQGTPYYLRFIKAFPTIKDLAEATEDEVLNQWQGLGYYSRARNMHSAAKDVIINQRGVFPKTYESIKSLKGVGDYTASAISSFAYNLPYPVVDGNVIRVISRITALNEKLSTTQLKNEVLSRTSKLFDQEDPARFNQAIMDFGALQCKPKRPNCGQCPLNSVCLAYEMNIVDELPKKKKPIKKKLRVFHYFEISDGKSYLLKKREADDIWKGLFDFPLIEGPLAPETIIDRTEKKLSEILHIRQMEITVSRERRIHILTHQKIQAFYHKVKIEIIPKKLMSGYHFVKRENLNNYAVPRLTDCYLSDKAIYLNT